jgi:hypothetical protein
VNFNVKPIYLTNIAVTNFAVNTAVPGAVVSLAFFQKSGIQPSVGKMKILE